MSKGYIRTSKINPCCICGDTSGKCRSKDDGGKNLLLCMTELDARKGSVINGYKCIKENDPTKSYSASTWVIDNSAEWTEEKRRDWERQREIRKQQEINEEKAKQECCLSIEERDKSYRELLAQLTLHPDDKADLLRRGLTEEEIERTGFKSVTKYHTLDKAVNPKLPGLNAQGKQLYNSGEGYLIPVKDVNGYILACQIRLRNPLDGSRYLWLSSRGNTLHVYPDGNKQLPLAIHKPIGKPTGIAIVEGTGVKPFLAANRLNKIVIGAAGGQWAASPDLLKEAIEYCSVNYEINEPIEVYPDAGSILNNGVMARLTATFNLLRKWGYRIVIKWWGQVTKNGQDIDELTDYSQIKDISVYEFLNLTKQPEVQQVIRSEKAWKNWRKKKGFSGDIDINSRYISDAIEVPKIDYCTMINGGLGSGKTTLVYKTIKHYPGIGWIVFGARNTLLRQFCGEASSHSEEIFYHLQDDLVHGNNLNGFLLIDVETKLADPKSNICCAIDSIIYFKPEYFDGKGLILDEFESTIKHLLFSNTAIAQWRERAKQLLIEAFRRCSLIICLDGNLKDLTAKLLGDLFVKHGIDKKIVKIKNLDNSLTCNEVKFYIGAEELGELKQNNRSVFLRYLLGNAGNDPFVVVADSQIFLEALESQLIQKGLFGLRVDSSTTNTEEVREFLKDADAPKEWILQYKPDYLLLSPSLENGGNINTPGYFKNIYAYFCGVLLTDEQLQILRRVRDSEALIHIFCRTVANPTNTVSTSPFSSEIEEASQAIMMDCIKACFEGLDFYEAIENSGRRLIEEAKKSEFFKYECELRSIANHERFNLRDCLHESLVNRGYRVSLFSECKQEDFLKRREKEVKENISELIHDSLDVTTEQAEEIFKNPKLPREEKLKAVRRRILDRLPGIEQKINEVTGNPIFNPELIYLIYFEDRRLISNLETLYFLKNPEIAKTLQRNKWHWTLESLFDENPKPFKLSTSYRSQWLRVKTLLELGITKFFDGSKFYWSNQDSDTVAIWQKAKSAKVSRALGMKVGKQTPCEFVGRLLRSLGFSTQSEGDKERIYKIKESPYTDLIRATMLECIATRVSSKMSETEVKKFDEILEKFEAEKPYQQRDTAAAPSASSLYNNTGGRCGEKVESQGSGDGGTGRATRFIYNQDELIEVDTATLKPVDEDIPASTPTATIEADSAPVAAATEAVEVKVSPVQELEPNSEDCVPDAVSQVDVVKVKPENLIGKAISYFSNYQNKLITLGRIKAIDSVEEVIENRILGIKRQVVSFVTTTGDYVTDKEIAKGVYQIT